METIFTSPTKSFELLQLAQLRDRLSGRAITPEESDYNTARQAWNLTVDQHPSLIIVAQSADDIVEAMHFAQTNNLEVAVQATGHGVIRQADNSLLIQYLRQE